VRGARAIPAAPELVGTYLLELAPIYRLNTLHNIASAIAFVHRLNGLASPSASLRPVWRTIVRQYGGSTEAPRRLALDEIETLIGALPMTRRGARDRALLLVAFWAGFRAGELVGLNLGVHTPGTLGLVRVGTRGVSITMNYPGTGVSPPRIATRLLDRQSQFCPVAALEHWLRVSGIAEGPIFRRVRRGDYVGGERLTSPNVSRLVRRIWSEAAGMLIPTMSIGGSEIMSLAVPT
jgi:integrase